ncbi:hypothetical protein ACER0A_008780 [Haloimpatiens sp. FM7315]|uniref:hypothetical protein n=1 Tax=Haloimpatiens sp. FM7315 TaxID=3298609 RepID=UPI00370C312E
MIRLKLELKKSGSISLKMYLSKKDMNIFLVRRVLMESVKVKNTKFLVYLVPMKYFLPLYNNLEKEIVKMHENSILTLFEYSDEYDGEFFYSSKITPTFMKKWRSVGCPKLYKISLDKKENKFNKMIIFEKKSLTV